MRLQLTFFSFLVWTLVGCHGVDALAPLEYPDASTHTRDFVDDLSVNELGDSDGELIDIDADGLPDGIDTNGDGDIDIPFQFGDESGSEHNGGHSGQEFPEGTTATEGEEDSDPQIDNETPNDDTQTPGDDGVDDGEDDGEDDGQNNNGNGNGHEDDTHHSGTPGDETHNDGSEDGNNDDGGSDTLGPDLIWPPLPIDIPDPDSPTDETEETTVLGNPCALTLSTKFIHTTNSRQITAEDLGDNQNLIVSVSSSDGTVTIDLDGVPVDRVMMIHAGSRNTVRIQNTNAAIGFCSGRLAGTDNFQEMDSNSSAPIVEILTAQGNGNTLNVNFVPDVGVRYSFSGSNHCLSSPEGSHVLAGEVNNNSHQILLDGSQCDNNLQPEGP